ncbi:MAG: hypothetical protein R2764_05340 [Bacteroidales bacterium]
MNSEPRLPVARKVRQSIDKLMHHLTTKRKVKPFSPTDLLATNALGSCMITIMGIAAREHGFDIDGTTAKI